MPESEVYIVFSNPPGPGAEPLARHAFDRTASYEAAMEAARGACEFVEVETADGMGVPLKVSWEQYGNYWRLGPFRATRQDGFTPIPETGKYPSYTPPPRSSGDHREDRLDAAADAGFNDVVEEIALLRADLEREKAARVEADRLRSVFEQALAHNKAAVHGADEALREIMEKAHRAQVRIVSVQAGADGETQAEENANDPVADGALLADEVFGRAITQIAQRMVRKWMP